MKRQIISAAAAAMILTSSVHSASLFAGALEPTQIANNIQLAMQYAQQLSDYAVQMDQYAQQVQQYYNQVQSFASMLQNIGTLPESQWNEFAQVVFNLKNIMEESGKVSYIAENLDDQYKALYKGYDQYLADANGGEIDPGQIYKDLSNETRDTVAKSLEALGLMEKDLESDADTMRELQSLSQSAEGQKAAIQAASEIALHQTNQLKKLHQTLMVQSQAQFEALAGEQSKQDMQKADFDSFNKHDDINTDDDQEAGGRDW